jgi:hypothetical protein
MGLSLTCLQWFSTFFSSRHTKVQKKFGGTLIPKKIANLTKRGFFPKKRIGKVRKKNLAAHLEGAHGTTKLRPTSPLRPTRKYAQLLHCTPYAMRQ